jgi:hypothetical protein
VSDDLAKAQAAIAAKKYGVAIKALRRIKRDGCWRKRTSVNELTCHERGLPEDRWCEPCIAERTLGELREDA